MKSPSERGVTGAWAYQARQELGLSVEQVADAMAARGQAVSPATIRGIESGSKKPGARLLRTLSVVLDSPAPGVAATPTEGGDLAAAVREQTVAIREQARQAERQADALEAILRLLSGRGALAGFVPDADAQAWAESVDAGRSPQQSHRPAGRG